MLSTNGDTHLGGEDFDQRLINHFTKVAKKKYNIDISKNKSTLQLLRAEVERAKRDLSYQHNAKVVIENIAEGTDF